MKNRSDIKILFSDKAYTDCLKALKGLDEASLTRDEVRIKSYSYQRLQRFEEAMNGWNILISRDGYDAEAYAERGVCKFHLSFKSSMEDFDKAVELEPENAYRYACRAFIKDKLGNLDGAYDDYSKSLELDPENQVTHNNMGMLQEKMGYNQRSQLHFSQADALAGLEDAVAKDMPEILTEDSLKKQTSVWTEVKRMISSTSEFKRFIRDLKSLFRKPKV